MVVKLATGDFHSTNVIKQGGIGAVTGGLASKVTVGLKPTNLPDNNITQAMNGMTPSTTQRTLAGSSSLRSTQSVAMQKNLEAAHSGVYGGVFTGIEATFDKASQSSLGSSMESSGNNGSDGPKTNSSSDSSAGSFPTGQCTVNSSENDRDEE